MKTLRYLLITALILTAFAAYAYASMDDKSDRMSSNQSNTFSPGYINATMQKTQEIIRQAQYAKSSDDNNIENKNEVAGDKLSNKVSENAATRVTPELKKKTGGSSEAKVTTKTIETEIENPVISTVATGPGMDRVYENDRMISEVIDGKRYVYAGFDNIGKSTIQEAMSIANSGDIVAIKAGTYGGINIKNGVSLYGGYSEDGTRDIVNTPTIVTGVSAGGITDATEINGFLINGDWASSWIQSSQNLAFVNNTFNGGYNIIEHDSSLSLMNNTFNGWCGLWVEDTIPSGSIYSSNNNYNSSWTVIDHGDVVTSVNDYFGGYRPIRNYNSGDFTPLHNPVSTPYSQLYNVANLSVAGYTTATTMVRSFDTTASASQVYADPYSYRATDNRNSLQTSYLSSKGAQLGGSIASGSVLREFIKSKDGVSSSGLNIDTAAVQKIINNLVSQSTLSLPISGVDTQEMQTALTLSNILKNPTSDQKLILDTMTALLNDVNKQAETSQSPEVKKASDDLLQVVANILIAQAMPDLLKEGDMSNIKGIFQDMNTQKEKIMMEYNLAIEPYYGEIKKLLAKNLSVLQLNNIVSKSMAEEELNKLEPNEVDRLMQKIKKMQGTSFEASYILQEESKLHSKHIDPNKKAFEEKMKAMLEGFTQRLSKILEVTKK